MDKINWMEEQHYRVQYKRDPSDPLYTQQWHLPHMEAKECWDIQVNGSGVTIAIVDDGLQHSHPDLHDNYAAHLSHDFNEGDDDPSPGVGDFHGTSCAGVAAAVANNTHCGCGVAPNATLVGIRLIAGPVTDLTEAAALSHNIQHIDIYSNSWGPNDDGMHMASPGRLVREALAHNVHAGRNGKGNIYVWASGNGGHLGDSCAYDGYAQSPYTIAVGAVNKDQRQSYYSEGCAALMCVAPSSDRNPSSGIVTVDVNTPGQGYNPSGECTSRFGGTSSACPAVAGALALLLQVNPNVSWRDVQILIAKSSKAVATSDIDWSSNSRGFRHHHKYGFGLIQSRTLVELARTWTNVPEQKGYGSGLLRAQLAIPNDASIICVSHTFSGSGITFVEHVLVRISLKHPRRGQLRIRLKSPENVVSLLADVHGDTNADYPRPNGWLFTSVRHFGEQSADGDWRLCIEDAIADAYGNGLFETWDLSVFGH
jgi:subtilisin family serine protease